MEARPDPGRDRLAARRIRGRPFDQGDHPAGHEPRRAHRLPGPGDFGHLHHPSARPGLDPATSSARRHFELAGSVPRVDDDLDSISLHVGMIPHWPGRQTARTLSAFGIREGRHRVPAIVAPMPQTPTLGRTAVGCGIRARIRSSLSCIDRGPGGLPAGRGGHGRVGEAVQAPNLAGLAAVDRRGPPRARAAFAQTGFCPVPQVDPPWSPGS